MAKKKQNLKGLNAKELTESLAKAQEELRKLRFKAEGARSKNVKESVNLRKEVARILTEVNSR
jgi:ribosomal protein L29